VGSAIGQDVGDSPDQPIRHCARTVTAPHLQVTGSGGASNVLPMTEIDPEGAANPGDVPPAVPPGPAPPGYLPSDQVKAVPVLSGARRAVTHPPTRGATTGPGGDLPFLDQPGAPPTTKTVAWRWVFYALAGFVVGQLLAGVFGIVSGHLAGKDAKQITAITSSNTPPAWYVLATLVGLWVGFFGAPWLASRIQGTRRLWADLGVRFKWVDLWGIAIGVGGQVVILLIYAPFQHDIHDFNGPSQKLTGGAHGGGFLLVALATVLLAPFMEELFFRGLLFRALARLCSPSGRGVGVGVGVASGSGRARGAGVVLAVIVDGLLFGLAHGEWVQLAGLALFGAALAAVSYRTGRLGMNMVAHAAFNLVAILTILSDRGGVIH
jgi:membrane protease YdiL (CAAX protease family)